MEINVRIIPDFICRVLKMEVKNTAFADNPVGRRSVNSEIVRALETEAAEADLRRQMRNLRKDLDRFTASLPPLDESAPMIRADRER